MICLQYLNIIILLAFVVPTSGFARQVETHEDLSESNQAKDSELDLQGNETFEISKSSLAWRHELSGPGGSPAIWGDNVFVVTFEGAKPRCYLQCIDFEGKLKWRKRITTPQRKNWSSFQVLATVDQVCVANNERIQVYSLTGKLIWKKELNRARGPGTFQWLARKRGAVISTELRRVFYQTYGVKNEPGSRQGMNRLHVMVRTSISEYPRISFQYEIEIFDAKQGHVEPSFYRHVGGSSHFDDSEFDVPIEAPLLYSYHWQADKGLSRTIRMCITTDNVYVTPELFRWNDNIVELFTTPKTKYDKSVVFATIEWTNCVDGLLVLLSKHRDLMIVLDFDNDALESATPSKEFTKAEDLELPLWSFHHDAQIATVLVFDKLVYMVDVSGNLICCDPRKKEICYRKSLLPAGHVSELVVCGGKLCVTGRDGRVVVFLPGPEFHLDSQVNLNEETFGAPAIGRRFIFVQTSKALYAFDRLNKGGEYR